MNVVINCISQHIYVTGTRWKNHKEILTVNEIAEAQQQHNHKENNYNDSFKSCITQTFVQSRFKQNWKRKTRDNINTHNNNKTLII